MAKLMLTGVEPKLEIEFDDDGHLISLLVINFSDGQYMTLDSRLDPLPDRGNGFFEFSFGFTIGDYENCQPPFFTQDRYQVAEYFNLLSKDYELPTAHVLPNVCASLTHFVNALSPDNIFRVTKVPNLPDKAMRKHELITDTLLGLSFTVSEEGTDDFNRRYTLMNRVCLGD